MSRRVAQPLPFLFFGLFLGLFCRVLLASTEVETPLFDRGWPGVVVPEQAIDIAAPGASKVQEILYLSGDSVESGAPVVKLDLRVLRQELEQAEAAVDVAHANRDRARLRFESFAAKRDRLAQLDQLLSRDQFAAAELDAAEAEAEFESASALVSQRKGEAAALASTITESTLRAPFAAKLDIRWVEEGAIVAAGEPIVRLISSSAVRVRFAIPISEAAGFDASHPLHIRAESSGRVLPARTVRVAPSVDLPTQMLFVEAEFEATQPGLTAGESLWVQRTGGQSAE